VSYSSLQLQSEEMWRGDRLRCKVGFAPPPTKKCS